MSIQFCHQLNGADNNRLTTKSRALSANGGIYGTAVTTSDTPRNGDHHFVLQSSCHTSKFIWLGKLFAFIFFLLLRSSGCLSFVFVASTFHHPPIRSCLSFPVNHQLFCCNLLWVGQIRRKLFAINFICNSGQTRVRHILQFHPIQFTVRSS